MLPDLNLFVPFRDWYYARFKSTPDIIGNVWHAGMYAAFVAGADYSLQPIDLTSDTNTVY